LLSTLSGRGVRALQQGTPPSSRGIDIDDEVCPLLKLEVYEIDLDRARIGGHELLRVGDRLTFVTTTMHALKSQPRVTTPWTAPSREVLQTIPSLNSFIGLWRQTDLIKSRQHYLHAGVSRPSSSTVSATVLSAWMLSTADLTSVISPSECYGRTIICRAFLHF
jgi:hypothetical protein